MEEVRYRYDLGGKVNHIEGQKPGHPLYVYIDMIHYDEFDQRTIEVDGNGIESHYSYNPLNRRLVNLVDYSNPMGTVLQDNNYDYDAVGNIISIVDNGLNQRSQDFAYDAQYRLIHSKGNLNLGFDAVYYDNYYKYSPAGRLINKSVSSTRANNIMGVYPMDYDNDYEYGNPDNPYATDHIHDNMGNDHDLEWDADGNLIHSTTHMPFVAQHHCWTEDNRLQAYSRISDDEGNMAAWYNYNAGGDRNFKLTTPQTRMRQNADVFRSGAALAYPTLYASSLVTVNKNGYTKHYFEGSRRVCSKIGGGFASVDQQYTDSQMPEIDESYFEQYVTQNENLMTIFSECLGINPQLDVYHDLYDVIMHEHGRDDSEPAFFYHSDHLGSAAYLTNDAGQVTQTLNYLPYGEDWVDIQNFAETQYPRLGIYSFNGKEKDYESGYHYYGARYYSSELLSGWLSVDPMMDKYPDVSPYNYCHWDPVNSIDPNGMWDVRVTASKNRGKTPYAILVAYDRNGNEVFRTVVKVKGNYRTRNMTNADTPTGSYKIKGWASRNNKISYGPNDVLELGMPDDKDWEGGTRSGILLHGGRQEGEYAKRTDLMSTHGCIRINDDDIAELKRITDALEKNDPEETRGYLTVSDDLDTPVTYSTDASIRRRVGLPEPVVEPEHSEDTPISILSKPNPICPADKTRVQLPYIPEL